MNAIETWEQVVLFGVGSSFMADVEATVARLGCEVAAYVANIESSGHPGRSTIAPEELTPTQRDLPCVIPLITPGHRRTVTAELDRLGLLRRPPLLDPTAPVAESAVIDEGVFVNAGSVIGGEVHLGRFVLINRSASVGHHSVISEFATVGPGVTIPANVEVKIGAFIGAGAVLLPGITVGANAVVGAGAVVVRDVEPNTVVVGNPAKVIRRDIVGYNEVGVT